MLSNFSIEDYGLSAGFTSMSCQNIVAKLNGPTSSDKGWSGTVGKLFSKVETLQRNTEFEPVPCLEPRVDISEDIASN